MEEKRKDLTSEKQKTLLQSVVLELSRSHPDFYYKSTSQIAYLIKAYVKAGSGLTQDDRALLEPLSAYDIQLLLSLN